MPAIQKYGALWRDDLDPLQIEFGAIQKGGKWKDSSGKECGLGLFEHYRNAQKLCWPTQDHHRWSDLTLKKFLDNKVTAVLGPQNSNKTFSAAKFALIDYWAFPTITCILVSSTDIRGLELRVWGKIKELWAEATDRFEWLPGKPIDYRYAITTDDIGEEETRVRVMNRGIVCIPCLAGGKYVGLGKYVGIKQKRLRLIADEAQLMGPTFLDAISNLGGNPDFKAILLGNPIDPMDPLGMAAEPLEGWSVMPEPEKTTSWRTRFKYGEAVNLVGTDSPNFDYPDRFDASGKYIPKYSYLIHKGRIEEIESFWGKDSIQYFSQGVGVMKSGLLSWRVITMSLCREHRAFEKVVWRDTDRTRIHATDIAYGGVGGDRCITGHGEFGLDQDGLQVLCVYPPVTVPVSIKNKEDEPEDQIARFTKDYLSRNLITVQNSFYDSTGRGTMGSAYARAFGSTTPVPIEFGGGASMRPVREDLLIQDERKRHQRHKRCDEHYSKFVSELWFTSRYAIEANQVRELPEEVAREGCQRQYSLVAGNKIEVESKHDPKARERMPQSPDLYDWFVTLIEGARQRGFKIGRLGVEYVESGDDFEEEESFHDVIQKQMLVHA